MITEPPLDEGAVQVITYCLSPAIAITPVGALGTVAGVTVFEGVEAGPVPAAFAAVTMKV